MGAVRRCCRIRLKGKPPFPRTDSCHALRDGRAEGGEAVEHRDADVKLGDLALEIARGDPLAESFEAPHLGLHAWL